MPISNWREHFDHLSSELAESFWETLALMQREAPVLHSDSHGGFWVVTRHADVWRIAQDWRVFSSAREVQIPAINNPVKALPEESDPPLQRAYRKLINPHFTPERVARYEGEIRAVVTQLLDGFVERGECDLAQEFARPFPGLVFLGSILGVPPEELPRLHELTTVVTYEPESEARPRAAAELGRWCIERVAGHRREPGRNELIDSLLAGEVEGRPITVEEVAGIVSLLIFGGLDTTANLTGNIALHFAEHPEDAAHLREHPEELPDAVEEFLRLYPPFVAIGRTATQDVEVGGQQIREGDRVLIYWAAANRDPELFEDPHRFRLRRPSNRHLAFGAGPHRCVGSNLARLSLRVVIEAICGRLHDLRLVPGARVTFYQGMSRGPRSLPMVFRPGPRRLAVMDARVLRLG